jgi:4-carboxymuconolactone decarboxylase
MGREVGEPELDGLIQRYPELWHERILPFYREVYEASGLDERTLELILVAVLALRGWQTGIRVHAKQALDAGATPDEVRGAVLAVLGVGGIHRVAVGMDVLEAVLKHGDDSA